MNKIYLYQNMKKGKMLFLAVIITSLNQGCQKDMLHTTNNHLKYFGFTLVDVGWDDPMDTISKTNYVDDPTARGGRHLPQNVKDEYIRIGKLITGK